MKQTATVKEWARTCVTRAVTSGELTKPDVCEECGEFTTHTDLCGHHADYSKPYEVAWLCRECHREYHRDPALDEDMLAYQDHCEEMQEQIAAFG